MHEPSPEETVDQETGPSVPVLRVELERPPRVRPVVLVGITAVAVLLLSSVVPGLVAQGAWDGLVLAIFAVLVVPLSLVLFTSKAPGQPVLDLGEDRMRLPITTRAHEFVTLRYREVTELFVRPGKAGFLWIGTARGSFVYPLRAFPDEASAQAVRGHIQAALEDLPDWSRREQGFTKQQQTADRVFARDTLGTKVLLGLMLLGFALQGLLQAANDPFAIVDLGANVPTLVEEGQLYRLFTSNLLHVDAYHLVMNGVLVLWIGGMIERLLGARAFVLIALLAGLLAPAASALSGRASVSAGVSGVAFGLLGAFAFTTYRLKGRLPLGLNPPMRLWLTLGILLAFMSLMTFGTDFPNHLGGFLAGVLVAAPLLDGDLELPLVGAARGPVASALIGILAATGLFSVGWAVKAALAADGADRTHALAHYLEHQPAPAGLLNHIAWYIAIDPEAPEARLEQARIAAHRAQSQLEADTAKRGAADTVATVYYRLGRFDEAIDREAEILEAESRKVYATQLARFLRARTAAQGVRADEGLSTNLRFEVRHHDNRGFGMVFEAAPPVEPARTAWFVVEREGELQGLLRLPLGARIEAGKPLWLRTVGVEPVWHEGSTFTLAWIQAGRGEARGWLMDEEALTYP